MVTHDPHAAAIADRILFLADGLIVRDMPRADAERRDRGDGRAQPGLMLRVALKGLAGPQAPRAADRDRDRPRRRDDQRHLRPHGHDQQRLRHDLHRSSYKNADVVVTGKAAFDERERQRRRDADASRPRCSTKVQALPDVAPRPARSRATALKLIGKDGKVIDTGGAPVARLLRRPAASSSSTRRS